MSLPREAGQGASAPPGLHELGHEALLYVPRGDSPDSGHPLVVMLHGAGGSARNGLGPLLSLADERGIVLLAPKSRGRTWDVILGGYGPDVATMQALLAEVFERVRVDRRRIGIGGFSDGASYALSVGLANGDVFSDILAFSPGFSAPDALRGRPRVFISHGEDDPVLPVTGARRIASTLRGRGYDVRYEEFSGGHAVPHEAAREAVTRFLNA